MITAHLASADTLRLFRGIVFAMRCALGPSIGISGAKRTFSGEKHALKTCVLSKQLQRELLAEKAESRRGYSEVPRINGGTAAGQGSQ